MTAHPLIERLVEQFACPVVNDVDLEAFLSRRGHAVLFCGGDPVQYPECLDVAVILPELRTTFADRFEIALAARGLESRLQALYGFQRWPSLVFLRDGEYLGVIQGMQDWTVYLQRAAELLDGPVSRPPSVGIPVASATVSHCH